MAVSKVLRTGVALAVLAAGLPARAQTAEQYNRAAQAIQICSSAMGAMAPECASLRGGLGAATARAGANPLAGLGNGGNNSTAAGLFGMAAQALAASRNQAVGLPAPQAFVASGFPSSADATNAALATQAAAQAYQACVMRVGPANTAGVQGCIAQLQAASGGYPAAAAVGFSQSGAGATALAPAAMNAFSAMLGSR